MEQHYRRISPQRESMIKFFSEKEKEVKSCPLDQIEIELEGFITYCHSFQIPNNLDSHQNIDSKDIDEKFRQRLLSNIRTAMGIAESMPIGQLHSVVTNITNSNHQEQVQTVNLEIIDKALRNSLTVDQYEEISKMIKNKSDKPTILEKLSEFGKDVLAGVLSTIISNAIKGF